MAEYDPTTFEGVYNNASTGSFKTTGLRQILAATMRQFTTDIKDSFASKTKAVSVTTTGGTLTLDFSGRQQAVFTGTASFAAAKDVALANDSSAIKFDLAIEITNVAATLDFGSGSVFKSNHADFDPSSQVFTPSDIGLIMITGTKVGSNWWLEFKYGFA